MGLRTLDVIVVPIHTHSQNRPVQVTGPDSISAHMPGKERANLPPALKAIEADVYEAWSKLDVDAANYLRRVAEAGRKAHQALQRISRESAYRQDFADRKDRLKLLASNMET